MRAAHNEIIGKFAYFNNSGNIGRYGRYGTDVVKMRFASLDRMVYFAFPGSRR
jgi:hypothetical protein